MELHELLDEVNDGQSFLRFTRALMADKLADSTTDTGWQNGTIEQFLESAIAWADATAFGVEQGLEPTNHWQQFAVFLYCGKIYE